MLGTPFFFQRSISRELCLIEKSNSLVKNTENSITLPRILRGHTLNTDRKLMHSYLTGLIEGDGKIYIPLNKEKKGCPSISISFPTKDLPLFLLIQKEINYGNIYKIKGKNAYEYVIGKLDGIVLVISYINGLMRTKKILKLYELIDFLNMKYPNLYNIVKLPLDNSDLGSNSWLAGFTEADGSFYVRVSKNSNCKTHKVYCKYELAQAYDNNNIYTFNIMTKICKFLLVDLKVKTKNNELFWISTNTYDSNNILIDYFNKYPLYGTKYLDYLDWCKIFNIIKNKEKEEKLDIIKNIKNNMNSKRTYFNWNHINNFHL